MAGREGPTRVALLERGSPADAAAGSSVTDRPAEAGGEAAGGEAAPGCEPEPKVASSCGRRRIPSTGGLEDYQRRFAALECVTEPSLSLLSADALLDALVHRVRLVLAADEATLLVVTTDDASALEVRASHGLGRADTQRVRVPIGAGFAGRVAQERRPIVIADAHAQQFVRPCLRELSSVVGVPLITRGRLVGVLHAGSRAPRRFGPDDVDILRLVADRAAATIERARAFEALSLSEERLALALDAAELGTWIGRTQEQPLRFDARAQAILGLSEPSMPIEGLLRNIDDRDRDRVRDAIARAFVPAGHGMLYVEFRVPGDALRWVQARGQVFFDEADAPRHFAGVVQDCTAHRAARDEVERLTVDLEQRVHERTEELEVANRELEAFSHSVSHDLRAPIRVITSFGALLSESAGERLTPEERTLLERIRAAAGRASTLMDDLLKLAQIGRDGLQIQPLDLAGIAREGIAALRGGEPGRDVTVRIPESLPAHGDPGLVRILLDNLLSNAWKFTRPVAAPVIELGVEEGPTGPVYFVRDNGVGFDMSDAERLFHPFERLHERARFEGTGIGLATAERIVGRHCGRIWATGAVGKGATFRFTLPKE